MKCKYYKICKLANEKSVVCLNGGGSYCGHYRDLYRKENELCIKDIEQKKLKKVLKYMTKGKSILNNLALNTVSDKVKDKSYTLLVYEIGQAILLIEQRIKERTELLKK